jgi:hypothetical protein
MRKLKNLTEDEEIEVFEERKSGLKRKDILDKWGISERHYKNIVLKFGGQFKEVTRWHYFNVDYFEKIDTEDKAYFLGFIIADGNIGENSNSISIIQKDPYILYEFKKYIEFSGDIYLPYKNRNICTINFSSSKTKNDLSKLGVFSNKTYTIKYPDIPEELQNHFIRGVFDGDGCIFIRKIADGYQSGFTITQCRTNILQIIRYHFGGSITTSSNRNDKTINIMDDDYYYKYNIRNEYNLIIRNNEYQLLLDYLHNSFIIKENQYQCLYNFNKLTKNVSTRLLAISGLYSFIPLTTSLSTLSSI